MSPLRMYSYTNRAIVISLPLESETRMALRAKVLLWFMDMMAIFTVYIAQVRFVRIWFYIGCFFSKLVIVTMAFHTNIR